MHKIVIALAATAAFTAPALAEVTNYPRSLAELEHCAKQQMSGGTIDAGCKTLAQRINDRVFATMED